jgi:cell division protein YceG involved in septum cleavage
MLYFVSNNHGGHVFSKTLAEHQHNVASYRRELKAELRSQKSGGEKH